jgi:DNA-binding Xre family transcriptional regulator
MLHIGQKIKEILEIRGITKTELSRRLGMTSTNVHKIFKRETIDTGLLEKIGTELGYDFFVHYYKGAEVTPDTNLNVKLQSAEKEIEYLKKIISLLEKKK